MKEKNQKIRAGRDPVRPKKGLGQNFLSEVSIIEKLVAAATIEKGQTILEIGPGTGNLTAKLLETGNRVLAIEKDSEMMDILKKRFADKENFELRNGDILEFDETTIAEPYKIAANLPFYLTAPLIRKFLESKKPPLSMTIIVQKEVAQRICAKPPQMSLLAISVQFYSKPETVSYVSKGCFWPVPKVDCAILKIVPETKAGERGGEYADKFFRVVKAGFSHPRKQLARNLANEMKLPRQKTDPWLENNGIKPNQRAETLSVENWIRLTDTFEL